MQLQTSCGILTGLLVALTVGCQSNSGVTRVPAPQTGVVGTGGGAYYSNKNSSNASYAPAGSTRSARGDSWSPRARGPIENIASNPDGRQISYEEPVGQDEPEVIRIPVRTQEQNRVNEARMAPQELQVSIKKRVWV